jgi:hypothetical protein
MDPREDKAGEPLLDDLPGLPLGDLLILPLGDLLCDPWGDPRSENLLLCSPSFMIGLFSLLFSIEIMSLRLFFGDFGGLSNCQSNPCFFFYLILLTNPFIRFAN